MQRAMADKMIAIIQEDATHMHRMFCPDGGMCALGGLYAAAVNKSGEELCEEFQNRSDPYAAIEVLYNLTYEKVQLIYQTNDSYEDITERRAALTGLINSWVEET